MRRAPGVALLLLLAALATAPAPRAQESAPDEDLQAQGYAPAPEEQSLLVLLDKEHKPLEAREAARDYLVTHPDSFVALLVTGTVCLEEDADLPRAYFYLIRAKKVLERRWPSWDDTSPWRLYGRTLWALRVTCQRMERYEEALALMERSDEVFDPDRPAEHAWALMKLGRIGKAREAIAAGRISPVEDEQLLALNSLGALESESDHPDEALEAFTRLYELQKKLGRQECTFVRNLAEAYESVLNYPEAERYYLESARYFDPNSESNPWQDLASLYQDEGRLAEAADALKKMQAWTFRSKPVIDLDSWNHRQTLAASLLLRLGYTEEALTLARRAADRPDRHGYGSAQGEQWEASSLLFLRAVLLDRAARLEEESSWSPWRARPGLAAAWAGDRLEAWSVGRRGARILMSQGWLADSLRGSGPRTAIAFPAGEGYLCGAVGAGVAEAEIRRLLARTGPAAERESPLLQLLLGQCLLEGGDARGALEALGIAERTLPRERGSFHDWLVALKARAHRSLGDSTATLADLAQLMERDPGLLRREGLALPVVLEAQGGRRAADAVERLARSPRLEPGRGGFRLTVSQNPTGALEAVLEGPDGAALARVRAPAAADDDSTVVAFCRLFHRKAFAPRVDLSQADINSLEGSTLAGEAARDALKGILGTTEPEPTRPQ